MLESLLARTSLPNLHPAVVHFPIALLVIALLADLAALLVPSRRWLASMGAALWVLGALGALAAVKSGEQAEEFLGISDPDVLEAVEEHEEWAERTGWAAGTVALLRLLLEGVSARRNRPLRLGRLAALGLGGAVIYSLAETADHGGALVYRHAVAVILPEPELPPPTASAAPAGAPAEWPATIGYALRHPEGVDRQAVAVVVEGDATSIAAVAGEAGTVHELRLGDPGSRLRLVGAEDIGDGKVEVEIDTTGFEGRLVLLHHLREGELSESLVLDGRTLSLARSDVAEPVASAEVGLAPGSHTLAVVANGRHRRGFLDGEMRVHAHPGGAREGRVGLEIEGTGVLRLLAWSVTPGPE